MIKGLFQELTNFVRHLFSGLVFVVLWAAGTANVKEVTNLTVIDLNKQNIIGYGVIAMIAGTIFYLLARYVTAPVLMYIFYRKYDSCKRGAGYDFSQQYHSALEEFLLFRFSNDFPEKMSAYLINFWGWVHGMGSLGLMFVAVILLHFTVSTFSLPNVVLICLTIGAILFLLFYVYHNYLLLRIETKAFISHFTN